MFIKSTVMFRIQTSVVFACFLHLKGIG